MHTLKRFFLFSIICLLSLSGFSQQQANTLNVKNIFDLKSVAEVVASPNQQFIAFSLNVPRPFNHSAGADYRELYVYDVQAGEVIPFITGNQSVFSLGWTPSGDAVTFRANFPDLPGIQVYAMRLRGGQAYPLTRHTGSVNAYSFIDHERLAIISAEPGDPARAELRRRGYEIEVYEEEYRHLNLYEYNISTDEIRQITRDVSVFDFALSPDGQWAAAAIAPRNLVDDSYMFKRIHLVNMQTGQMQLLVDNPGKLGRMVWSPDGRRLAFQSASKLEDSVIGSLFVVDVPEGGNFDSLRNYVKDMELSVIDIGWEDSATLLYAAEMSTEIGLNRHRLDAADPETVIEPGRLIFRRFQNIDGNIYISANSPVHPSEVFRFDKQENALVRISHHNSWLENIRLARQEQIRYKARDNKEIHGVLLYPLNYEQGKKYPLIVYIHGGPEAAVQNGWTTNYSTWGQVASASDYFVFMPNYRASSGRGVDFTMAGYGDLVGVEYEDVLDGIDHLIDKGYVDRERVGIGGGSYGGYFSAWSATRYTDRFAAAVMFVGISNQISKRNTTDIPWEDYHVHWGFWTHENMEDVYSRSPVAYAHQSLTPLLILHGDQDPRVHPSQGLEMYRALKLHGQAPVRLIWYQGEGHGNRKNLHRFDYIVRTMDWFDHYLRLDRPRDQMPEKYPDALFE